MPPIPDRLRRRQTELSLGARDERMAQLASEEFDLLVVGGGITGCGVALDAAARGVTTALVEARDFASGTSSRSSKLIHGGLRYLRHREFGMVREASVERRRLQELAPGLVSSLPFVLPVYGSAWESLRYRVGLTLYDLVANFGNTARHRRLHPAEVESTVPGLQTTGLDAAYRYFDAVTDDARLTIQVAKVAASLGAVLVNHARVTALHRQNGRTEAATVHDALTDREFQIRARKVVLAGGVWMDELLALDDPKLAPNMRPARGVNIVVPGDRLPAGAAIAMTVPSDGRLVFAIPWHHRTLISTTDSPYSGDLAHPEFEMAEVDYLLEVVDHYFPGAGLGRQDVVAAQAGLRPLIAEPGKGVEDLSRRERLIHTPSGVLAVGGGKLTTYRPIAEKVVAAVIGDLAERGGNLPEGSAGTECIPLNRRIDDTPVESRGGVSGLDDADYLEWAYGADARLLSSRATGADARPILPGRPYVEAEIDYAVDREMAVRLSDFLSQRLRCLLIDDDQGMAAAERVASIMGCRLGWDEHQRQQQVATYRKRAGCYSPGKRGGGAREAG